MRSSFLQDWRGRHGGGEGRKGGGVEGVRGGERRPEEMGHGARECSRGDKALGTDRGMNNLSTLLMDRLREGNEER